MDRAEKIRRAVEEGAFFGDTGPILRDEVVRLRAEVDRQRTERIAAVDALREWMEIFEEARSEGCMTGFDSAFVPELVDRLEDADAVARDVIAAVEAEAIDFPEKAGVNPIERAARLEDVCRFALEVIGRQSQFYRGDAMLARLANDIEATLGEAPVNAPNP